MLEAPTFYTGKKTQLEECMVIIGPPSPWITEEMCSASHSKAAVTGKQALQDTILLLFGLGYYISETASQI